MNLSACTVSYLLVFYCCLFPSLVLEQENKFVGDLNMFLVMSNCYGDLNMFVVMFNCYENNFTKLILQLTIAHLALLGLGGGQKARLSGGP